MELELTKCPEYSFLRGIACRDIVQLRLLSLDEKKNRKWGDPDVEIKSLWFKNYNLATNGNSVEYITRAIANQKFVTTEGKKLNTRILRADKKYMVYSNLPRVPVYVITPSTSNVTYTINNKKVPEGVYVVFIKDGDSLLFEAPIFLKPSYFKRMIKLLETPKQLAKRIRRYDTALDDKREAQYRVVAMAIDTSSFIKIGYILSYMQEDGTFKEKLFNMKKVFELLENNNIRNMHLKRNFVGQLEEVLTYGRLIELPTHFVNLEKEKN